MSDSGFLSFRAARLAGHSSIRLPRAKVTGGFLEFSAVALADSAALVFDQLEVSDGGTLGLHWAQLSGRSRVFLDGSVIGSRGSIAGRQMGLSGHTTVSLEGAAIDAADVRFEQTTITQDSCLTFTGALARGGRLALNDLVIAERGRLRLDKTQLGEHSTNLRGTRLHGGSITIGGARLEPESVSLPNGRWALTPANALPQESTVQSDRITKVIDPGDAAEA